jgi:multidrug efflux pump subunit AcrA (membrane-fusion protein)
MNPLFVLLSFAVLSAPALRAADSTPDRVKNTVVLDANAVANLRLETVSAEPREFEETVFALGRIEPRHGAIAVLSSRISGRVVELSAHLGDVVVADEELVRVESRQAGDPPPVVALRAPQAGTITDCEIHLGDPIEPDRHLLEITDLTSVEAVARVPEHEAGRLRPGTLARIRITAYPGEDFTGKLTRFATAADPATGTLAAHFLLPNPDGRLRPGLRAEFAIIVSSRADVLAVPRAAVQGEGAGPRFVFIKDFELANAFLKAPVVVGATNDRYVEVLRGLFPGDEVVVRGAYSLSFAGGGGVSLKEALDAAHGHEHAADGSELKSGSAAPSSATDDHGHGHGHEHGEAAHAGHPELPWQIATGVLALIALVLAFTRRASTNRKET